MISFGLVWFWVGSRRVIHVFTYIDGLISAANEDKITNIGDRVLSRGSAISVRADTTFGVLCSRDREAHRMWQRQAPRGMRVP